MLVNIKKIFKRQHKSSFPWSRHVLRFPKVTATDWHKRDKPTDPDQGYAGDHRPAVTSKTFPQCCCPHEDTIVGELELTSRMDTGVLGPKQSNTPPYHNFPLFYLLETKNQHNSQIREATSCVQCIHV